MGEEHPDSLSMLENLAHTYGKCGDNQMAVELFEKLYSLQCKLIGERHPYTLKTLKKLIGGYRRLGDFEKANTAIERFYMLNS